MKLLSGLVLLGVLLAGSSLSFGQEKAGSIQEKSAVAPPAEPAEPGRMSVDELKAKIAKAEPVLVIDSRSSGSYDGSDKKIKGSIRLLADDYDAHLKDLPRDKEIVIYCS